MSVVLLPPGFAAFQNCFCAEYLFIGHSLKRQSKENKKRERVKFHHVVFIIVFTDGLLLDINKRGKKQKRTIMISVRLEH